MSLHCVELFLVRSYRLELQTFLQIFAYIAHSGLIVLLRTLPLVGLAFYLQAIIIKLQITKSKTLVGYDNNMLIFNKNLPGNKA